MVWFEYLVRCVVDAVKGWFRKPKASEESIDILTSMETDTHPLLDSRAPVYSECTVRRALIVWLRCGQQNDFRDVCKYYHYLEAMEEKLPADVRESSQQLDFSLFTTLPPTSPYQQRNWGHLYPPPPQDQYARTIAHMKAEEVKEEVFTRMGGYNGYKGFGVTPQEIFDASQVFKSESDIEKKSTRLEVSEFLKLSANAMRKEEISKMNEAKNVVANNNTKFNDNFKGTSKQDILETSQMIRNYCKVQQVPLRRFLENFKEYASKCDLSNTVNNVGFYIKRKMIHSELALDGILNKDNNNETKINKENNNDIDITTIVQYEPKNNKINQNQMIANSLLSTLSTLNIQDDNSIFNGKIYEETEDSKNIIAYNDDLITFDDDTNVGQSEKIMTLLKREDGLKSCAGFSNSHNLALYEILKCRKV